MKTRINKINNNKLKKKVSHTIKTIKSKQAPNMRLIGKISAIAILIVGACITIWEIVKLTSILSVMRYKRILTFDIEWISSSTITLEWLIIIIVTIVITLWQAFFWFTIFNAGGEALEQFEAIAKLNNTIIKLLDENSLQQIQRTTPQIQPTSPEIQQTPPQVQQVQTFPSLVVCQHCGQQIIVENYGIFKCPNCGSAINVSKL